MGELRESVFTAGQGFCLEDVRKDNKGARVCPKGGDARYKLFETRPKSASLEINV